MYFIFGLIFIAAVIVSISIIGKALAALAAFVAKTLKRLLHPFRLLPTEGRVATPILRMPAMNRDWEAISRETRRRILEQGPRANREIILLSHLDLEIAIEMKKQELRRLKVEAAALKAKSAKPRQHKNGAQFDLFAAANPEPTPVRPAASGGDGILSPSGRWDGAWDRPDWPSARQPPVQPRVVQSSRFRH